jgi:hypothetical protein
MDFEWLEKRTGAARGDMPGETAEMRAGELLARAKLFAKLGYSREETAARLQRRVKWEYERVGSARVAKKIDSLVKQAFELVGSTAVASKAAKPQKSKAKARR